MSHGYAFGSKRDRNNGTVRKRLALLQAPVHPEGKVPGLLRLNVMIVLWGKDDPLSTGRGAQAFIGCRHPSVPVVGGVQEEDGASIVRRPRFGGENLLEVPVIGINRSGLPGSAPRVYVVTASIDRG